MGSVLLQVILTVVFLVSSIQCEACPRVESLDITSGDMMGNGSVIHHGIEYSSGEWYEAEEGGVQTRFGCPCVKRKCLWKCCEDGEAFFNGSCTATDISEVNPFNPTIYEGEKQLELSAHGHFFFMHNKLCVGRYLVDPSLSSEELYIQQNASLKEIAMGQVQWHASTGYCAEMMLTDGAPRMVALVCFPAETDDSPVLYIAYAVGLLLSVMFLMATLLVYAFIPELRNLHGMCLMAYCGGLIVAYIFLAILKLNSNEVGVPMAGCLLFAFIVYYSFQTSFFWLNVMCFDIWRTFSGYRGGSNYKRREIKRFALYGVYAWGVPLALTAITAAMQLNDGLPSNIIRPNFGLQRCWFESWENELVYFFPSVLILVVCNVVLFVVTASRIRSIRQETAILKGSESARSDKLKRDKQRYGLYLKLFFVMGVNWTVEVVSFAAGGSNWYWILTDVSNIALGFFIFMIFVWKNKVRNLIHRRIRSFRGVTATTDSTTRSSSAPTEDTRVSADDTCMRPKEHR